MKSWYAKLAIGTLMILGCASAHASEWLFSQCSTPCPIGTLNPTALSMIETTISAYNVQVSQGLEPPLTVGAGVELEAVTVTPAGYVKTDRYFTITNLPVNGWEDLIDDGTFHDTDTYTVMPPPPGGAGLYSFLAHFGNAYSYHIELPWPGYPGG